MANNLLPEKLRQLRKAKRLKQIDIAVELDIEQSTYSGYETGRHNPNPDMLYKIAGFYGISVDVLMSLAAENYKKEQPSEPSKKTKNRYLKKTDSDSQYMLSAGPLPGMPAQVKELTEYLDYVNDPMHKTRLAGLSQKETTMLYLFSHLNAVDQNDLIEFIKIRLSHN
ncbi:MAG: helix-turn-helix transcriptional regulator [Lachnospiraceae bacterium]|nr:helix-turn-helix transcriptional regulator [Lachnospiraceae bacterium]